MRGQTNAARHKNTVFIYITSFIAVTAFILLTPFLSKASEITLADVAEAQERASAEVETMSASIVTETEFGGETKALAMDYALESYGDGTNKVMVKSKGPFEIQYIADTAEGSVTFLMADGTPKKFTLESGEFEKIMSEYSSIGGFMGSPPGTMFASAGGIRDAAGRGKNLRVRELENAKQRVSVRREFLRNRAIVEYENKNMELMKEELDRNIRIAEEVPAKNEKDRRIKKRYLEKIKADRENIKRNMTAGRVEKINLGTGVVEETEFFNSMGERIGRIRAKKTAEFDTRKGGEKRKRISLPVETEGEMMSVQGRSRFRTKLENVKINEPVSFEFVKIKRGDD